MRTCDETDRRLLRRCGSVVRRILALALWLCPGTVVPGTAQTTQASQSSQSPEQIEQAVARYEDLLAHPAPGTSAAEVEQLRVRLGTAYFLLHRYPESLHALAPILANGASSPPADSRRNPEDRPLAAQAWLLCGLDHLELSQAEEAITPLRRSLALDAKNANARLALGDAFARTRQMDEAEEQYEDQLRLTPSLPDAWYKLGMVHIQLAADWKRSLDAQPDGRIPSQELTARYQLAGEANWDAARLLLALSKAAPSQPEVHADLGRALFALGYVKSAAEEFNKELTLDADEPTAMLGLAEAEAMQEQWIEADAEIDRLARSQPHEFARLVESAPPGPLRQAWNDGATKIPPDLAGTPEGHFWTTWLTTSSLTPDALAPMSNSAAPCRAISPDTEAARGEWLSEACYRQLLKKLENAGLLSDASRGRLVETMFRLGDNDGALREAKILQRAHPADPWAAYWLSRAHSELAGDCFVKLGLLDPSSPRVHQMLAERYLGWGQFTQSVAEYQSAIRLAPELPDLYLGLADTYSHMLDWTHAVTQYRKALELAPGSVAARAGLGHTYVKLGEWQPAIAELSEIPADAPQAPAARLDLAGAEDQVGDTRKAIEDLTPYLNQDRDGEIHFRLAVLYRRIGDMDGAKQAMAEFQKLRAAELAVSHGEIQALEEEKSAQSDAPRPPSN
jgi:tetratricopeptide (TPR) repeat protein